MMKSEKIYTTFLPVVQIVLGKGNARRMLKRRVAILEH